MKRNVSPDILIITLVTKLPISQSNKYCHYNAFETICSREQTIPHFF